MAPPQAHLGQVRERWATGEASPGRGGSRVSVTPPSGLILQGGVQAKMGRIGPPSHSLGAVVVGGYYANLCFSLLSSPLSPQVKIWFQNRRMKWRNSKERELLSSGGCREQTLPTKLNPHPDLSDVGQKGPGDDEEDDEGRGSPRHRLVYHASPDPRHLRVERLEGPLPPSPAHSGSPDKPSDFSDSEEDEEGEEEEITVS